ncbi:S-adenosylmethionine hydroxide adenosyltransferase [Hydrogenispora ethanolica]|uniref:S-adenosylmethionine hydroxide adenosyltransferase n=1 Tax=Hydrogenispora ethanolica TaxID=1082276 RepID=A0A4R1QRM9_HYDET|nr:tyrosine-protein phosphatase [Hydrogenispora ethanolica]TCL56468.1 S-adenosylmethionine hydroxide adenosyltransferase [Hydrogenispora ethanolica]
MKQAKRIISFLMVAVMVMAFSLSMTVMAADSSTDVVGIVAEVQKYGNLTMDIKPKALYDAGYKLGDILKVTAGVNVLKIPFCTSYSDVDTGSLVVRDDRANNLLIVAINMGNFSTQYNVKVGDKVTFSLAEKEGYLSEYQLRQLKRTNVRSDYATDSIFANFRSIATTGIKPAVLYRSSSPVNNELGRAAYANALAKAVGIGTVLNLADSDEEIKGYFESKDFASDYYKSLYDAGKVKALNMDVNLAGKDFGKKLAEGLRFLSKNNGPYLIHCTEGKDRAGFVSAVLESLMGAKLDEVVADYMTTYENYYGVKKESEQYTSIANSNIVTSLTTVVCGYPKGTDISKVNLAAASEKYLKKCGMTSNEIAALKKKLSADSVYKTPKVSGKVKEIEKYGHALTEISIEDFYKLGFKAGDMVTAIFDNGFVLEAPFLDGYYVDPGKPLVRAYPGQTNIAVCINYGKLNEIAHVKVGDRVTIMLTGRAGYLTQYEIRKLKRTNNRADYPSDEVFANFRNITVGKIAGGVLYRSSSPINNELGRASYADHLMKEAKVNTVINLADSPENIKTYLAAKDFASPYYAELFKNDRVLCLNMGLAYTSPEFKAGIIKALVFMAENQGPYLFHCTEGKDRAGFFAALLESLMGASQNEIVEDYLQSYINYYGVQKGTDKYSVISGDVLVMLKFIAGTADLDKVDLATAAQKYLLSGGMTAKQIEALKTNLSTKH